MTQQLTETQVRVGGFRTIEKADEVIRSLLAEGFHQDQVIVVCPPQFQEHFLWETPKAEAPSPTAVSALAEGGIVGASLGGIALAATVLSGGAAAPVAVLLIGGGALAGGIGNFIASKGYDEEADDYYKLAIHHGLIVVGVEISADESHPPIEEAERILKDADAATLMPA